MRRSRVQRTTGRPASANGASSMHLWWRPDMALSQEVSAVLEVVEPPTVDRLYFWALQATFVDTGRRPVGGAHLGLQWFSLHPGSTAVNWGGYRSDGTGELGGASEPSLPSATGNPNTRDYRWRPGVRYRLRITADGTGAITDLGEGVTTVVRRLAVPGSVALVDPVVWSEVFADCDDPSASVRWSRLDPPPRGVHVTYQSIEDGGCTNTSVDDDGGGGFIQRTNTARTTPPGRLY